MKFLSVYHEFIKFMSSEFDVIPSRIDQPLFVLIFAKWKSVAVLSGCYPRKNVEKRSDKVNGRNTHIDGHSITHIPMCGDSIESFGLSLEIPMERKFSRYTWNYEFTSHNSQ